MPNWFFIAAGIATIVMVAVVWLLLSKKDD